MQPGGSFGQKCSAICLVCLKDGSYCLLCGDQPLRRKGRNRETSKNSGETDWCGHRGSGRVTESCEVCCKLDRKDVKSETGQKIG